MFALYRAAAVVARFAQRRSDFVSAVTHELKTPLAVIRMNAEMLQETWCPETSNVLAETPAPEIQSQ